MLASCKHMLSEKDIMIDLGGNDSDTNIPPTFMDDESLIYVFPCALNSLYFWHYVGLISP
jgi:hypothetical protein